MLTIFCTAKPFRGQFKIIQENALRSWTHVRPRPEILLFGDEEGYSDVADELGLRRMPVERNEFGTPLVSTMFATAQAMASYSLLCYLEADILVPENFARAIETVAQRIPRFLMLGTTLEFAMTGPIDFSDVCWRSRLETAARARGETRGPWAMDYFAFPRGCLPELPPFAAGRPHWDPWLVYHARCLRIPVVDASDVIRTIHQTHGYTHHPDGWEGVVRGPEAQLHLELIGPRKHFFSIWHATHLLTDRGVEPARAFRYLRRRLESLPILYPAIAPLGWLLDGPSYLLRWARRLVGV
jgi:hypothetical protein